MSEKDRLAALLDAIDAAPGAMWIETFRRLRFDTLLRARNAATLAPTPTDALRKALWDVADTIEDLTFAGKTCPEAHVQQELAALRERVVAALAPTGKRT